MADASPAAQVLATIGVDGGDGVAMPVRICRVCVAALPVDGATLALIAGGAHRELVGASDDASARVEELEITVGEGPGFAAHHSGGPVLVDDLAGPTGHRWPAFTEGVAATGVAAAFAFPLQLGAVRLGALTLYRKTAGRLPAAALTDALQIADVVTLLMIGRGGGLAEDFDARWLDRSGWTREVDQATGMLAVQLGVGAEEAFVRLRSFAFAHNLPLSEVARDVVARRLRLARDGA